VMLGLMIGLVMGVIGAAMLLAVVFAPVEKSDAYVVQGGQPLAIEATSCERPRPLREVEHVGVWDEVYQHWGETQWMMAVG
jgi:hypothetical protein